MTNFLLIIGNVLCVVLDVVVLYMWNDNLFVFPAIASAAAVGLLLGEKA